MMNFTVEEINENRKKLERAKNKNVICDVCEKQITSERFKVVMVFDADRVDHFFNESLSNQEKDLIVCNECIENLNFSGLKAARR